jgi:pimeloyl-ACP methyl ester carboxylesterase
MPFLKVEGRRAFYVHRLPVPAGIRPVIYLHGAGGTHQHWRYQVRDLPHTESYALDLPGHGQSEGDGRESIQAYADWLIAFLEAAGLGPSILVGHSMGGAIALLTALQKPSRVAGLGLVATGARLRVAPALLQALREDFSGAVALMGDWAYGPEAPQEMVRLGQRQLAATAPGVLYGDFLACDGFGVVDRLGEITAPTLVLCGTQDRMTPVKYAAFLRDNIHGARLHLVEGAGHMLMIENPGEVAQAVDSFASLIEGGSGLG